MANSKVIRFAMEVRQDQMDLDMVDMGEERKPFYYEDNVVEEKQKEDDTWYFLKKAWHEILLSIYTMIRTFLQLFLDTGLCYSYYMSNDYYWFILTLTFMIGSNLITCLLMLSIQYGSSDFKHIRVLIESSSHKEHGREEKKLSIGILHELKKMHCCIRRNYGEPHSSVATFYHVLPNFRVFYYEDYPDKSFNIKLPQPPKRTSLKFNAFCLPFLALFSQIPTHLEYVYLKWRRAALISLRRDGNQYHEAMVKCVFIKNILQMVIIIQFGERAFQLFLQLYIVTQTNHVSPLQLSEILVGFFTMMFSAIHVQTNCSFMNRNLWENGIEAYIGALMVYVSMMFLAFSSLAVVFVYSAIFHHALAFTSFTLFLVFLLSHYTRGVLTNFRPCIVPLAKLLFWVLFGLFIYSDYFWHKCMMHFSELARQAYNDRGRGFHEFHTNATVMICEGATIAACNVSAIADSSSSSWLFSKPFLCVSVYYDRLYFIVNIVPYIVLLFAFMSPLYKGFEYYYDYKPKILPGDAVGKIRSSSDEIKTYYKELERTLSIANSPAIIMSVVRGSGEPADVT